MADAMDAADGAEHEKGKNDGEALWDGFLEKALVAPLPPKLKDWKGDGSSRRLVTGSQRWLVHSASPVFEASSMEIREDDEQEFDGSDGDGGGRGRRSSRAPEGGAMQPWNSSRPALADEDGFDDGDGDADGGDESPRSARDSLASGFVSPPPFNTVPMPKRSATFLTPAERLKEKQVVMALPFSFEDLRKGSDSDDSDDDDDDDDEGPSLPKGGGKGGSKSAGKTGGKGRGD
ncbi:unnamed protein product, partial [Phaeothamnion confervicola]